MRILQCMNFSKHTSYNSNRPIQIEYLQLAEAESLLTYEYKIFFYSYSKVVYCKVNNFFNVSVTFCITMIHTIQYAYNLNH